MGVTPQTSPSMERDLAELREMGYLTNDSAVARVVERLGLPGSEDYPRMLEVSVGDGFRFEVLPTRGFDIGMLEYAGLPLAWISPVSDHRALDTPSGSAWLSRFNGGLLATCGLRHFGQPTEREGLHGDIGHLPAANVSYKSNRDEPRVELNADVRAVAIFAESLTLSRRIASGLSADGLPYLDISDVISNEGLSPCSPKVMYHLNFGAPLVLPGTGVEMVGRVASDPDGVPRATSTSWVMPQLTSEICESVVQYAAIDASPDGRSHCEIRSPSGLAIEVSWTSNTLPFVNRWTITGRDRWALAIEPASDCLEDASQARNINLAPGELRRYGISIRVTSRAYGATLRPGRQP